MKNIKRKNLIKVTDNRKIFEDDYSNRPHQANDCNSVNCKHIFDGTLSEDQLVVDANHVFFPIRYDEFLELCDSCQLSVCNWWSNIYSKTRSKSKISLELFKLDMELSAAIQAIAASKGKDLEVNRTWREDVCRRMKLNGADIDTTSHPLYDFLVVNL